MLKDAVKTETDERYAYARSRFWTFVAEEYDDDEAIDDLTTLDVALCDFIVELYTELPTRGNRQLGIDAKAGLAAHYGFSQTSLALSARAVKAWDRKVPGKSPPPLSYGLMLCVARQMRRQEKRARDGRRLAACLVLAFGAYLRASDLRSLRGCEVALPGDPRLAGGAGAGLRMDGKTGRNQFIALADPLSIEALTWLRRHTRSNEFLCPYSYDQLRLRFGNACRALGLGDLGFTLHSARHGGATRDFAGGVPIAHIALVGRWYSQKTLLRYIQSGRALLLALQVPPDVAEEAADLTRDTRRVWS